MTGDGPPPDHWTPHGTCTECGDDDAAWNDTLCSDCRESNPDGGTGFGLWDDPTSRLIYRDAMPALLSGIDRTGRTLDLGGGNGLSREWFHDVTTVDTDPTKEPDVVADALTYVPDDHYDRVLLRYVLHYLDDESVRDLFSHLLTWFDGELVVVQFVNDDRDLSAKRANSVNETKFFRPEWHLRYLVRPWVVERRVAVSYDVDPEFYRNRLGHPNPVGHPETVVAYTLGVPR